MHGVQGHYLMHRNPILSLTRKVCQRTLNEVRSDHKFTAVKSRYPFCVELATQIVARVPPQLNLIAVRLRIVGNRQQRTRAYRADLQVQLYARAELPTGRLR